MAVSGVPTLRAASPRARPEVRAAVRVRFAAPRLVPAVSSRGDTLEVPGGRLGVHYRAGRAITLSRSARFIDWIRHGLASEHGCGPHVSTIPIGTGQLSESARID
jgi:hypothetical protein